MKKMLPMKYSLVTGGAGFIGSHLTDYLIEQGDHVLVLDKLTYAGDLRNLEEAQKTGRLTFIEGDICDQALVYDLLKKYDVKTVCHLAAESHVDNSINDSSAFIQTNIFGTHSMLSAALKYWEEKNRFPEFRFVHVSTDEVFGQLSEKDPPFNEMSPYAPNSPYSASKAASDHLARAWFHTYKLPVIITNCSNNYGPRQHSEKLIPAIIRKALEGNPIPIYGTGRNIRDWLYVNDHCEGLHLAALKGRIGESYCFGGNNEKRNIDLAKEICYQLDTLNPCANGKSYVDQIIFVKDRKGHDFRYAIDSRRAAQELGWTSEPASFFKTGLQETIKAVIKAENLS
jgi:dTDP-glucose 4,6-dehydratase